MNMPPPDARQARVLWFSLTALAVGVLVGLLGLLIWGLGCILQLLTPVLLPLALAGMLAYLLDPVVTFFVKRKQSRLKSILIVFGLVFVLMLALLATVVPRLVVEGQDIANRIPEYSRTVKEKVNKWVEHSPWMTKAKPAPVLEPKPEDPAAEKPPVVPSWISDVLPTISTWLFTQAQRLLSWVGLLLGLLLVPVYLFYFLLERDRIEKGWRKYLPISNALVKEEAVFIISSINDSLIVFLRGQVLVSLCSGTLLTIAFLCMGLNYAVFLGVMAGCLGIIPYLGVLVSIVPALALAGIQFQDWWHPGAVLIIFGVVNALEGFVISPKIIGDRIGLHPLVIMIAVITGGTLLGGIVGGLLAIPLTAALRAMMYRYVWQRESAQPA